MSYKHHSYHKHHHFSHPIVHIHLNNAEILFALLPSIFMPYLDSDTFCQLVRTDIWNWHNLLCDRILFDYCKYLSRHNQDLIEQYCRDCYVATDESAYDSSDTVCYRNETDVDTSEDDNDSMDDTPCITAETRQNFAILRVQTSNHEQVDCLFILNHFKYVDLVMQDSMLFTTCHEIGLTANLCRNISTTKLKVKLKCDHNNNIVNNNNNNNNNSILHDMTTILAYDNFDTLCDELQCRQIYNRQELQCIAKIMLMDILRFCVHTWYFAQYPKDDEYEYDFEEDDQHKANHYQIKQMIIAHIDSTNVKQHVNASQAAFDRTRYSMDNCINTVRIKQELFAVWCIEKPVSYTTK